MSLTATNASTPTWLRVRTTRWPITALVCASVGGSPESATAGVS
jgi:hypothetical protein